MTVRVRTCRSRVGPGLSRTLDVSFTTAQSREWPFAMRSPIKRHCTDHAKERPKCGDRKSPRPRLPLTSRGHRAGSRLPVPGKAFQRSSRFITPDLADFAIERVGARAGRVHRDFTAGPNSHYFIRGDVEADMRRLDFTSVMGNAAGNPSLSKSEIVLLYSEWIGRGSRGSDITQLLRRSWRSSKSQASTAVTPARA